MLVDDATRRRISQATTFVRHKETLSDALVDYYNSNFREFFSLFIVEIGNSSMELANFAIKDLLSLLLTNSVTVNDEVRWLRSLVVLEDTNGFLYESLHLRFDQLLSLRLNNIV